MTDDDSDNTPVTVRLSPSVLRWLEGKRQDIKQSLGLDVSLQTVLKSQIDRAKRLDDDSQSSPRGPKKARPHT